MEAAFVSVISNVQSIEEAFPDDREEGGVQLTDYDGSWESEENKGLSFLLYAVHKVMRVQWHHTSFPRFVPDDFTDITDQDRQVLNEVLDDPNNDLSYFHQLGQGLIDA